jgi:hypothetical protein
MDEKFESSWVNLSNILQGYLPEVIGAEDGKQLIGLLVGGRKDGDLLLFLFAQADDDSVHVNYLKNVEAGVRV